MTNKELESLCREFIAKAMGRTDQDSKRLTTLLAKVNCGDMVKPTSGQTLLGLALFSDQLTLLPHFTPRQWLPFIDELTFLVTYTKIFSLAIAGLDELTETLNQTRVLKQLQDLPSLSLEGSPISTTGGVSSNI